MARVGLSAYRIRIKDRTRGSDWWAFARGSATDGYAAIEQYVGQRKGLCRLGDPLADGSYADQRAVLFAKIERNEKRRVVAGIVLKGEAGAIREIRNFDDPEADPVYRTSLNEGILLPLYFRFHMEDGRPFGLVLLQTLGSEGLKGYLNDDLRRHGSADGIRLSFQLAQFLDLEVLKAFATQGSLQDVVLINSARSVASRQAMERNTIAGDRLGEGDRLELRVVRSAGFSVNILRQLWRAVKHSNDPRTLVRINGLGAVDDIKVSIVLKGRSQKFSLLNPDDSPVRFDITDQVKFDRSGFPTWDSVHAAADDAWAMLSDMI